MKKVISILLLIILIICISACDFSTKIVSNNSLKSENTKNSSLQFSPKPTPTPRPKDGIKSDGKIHVYIVGRGEKVYTPESSFIGYITYYSESKHLIIYMNSKEYVFANISSSLWSDFKLANSKGHFYNENIRNNKNFYVNDYDGNNGNLIVLEYIK